jgi:DNA repair protein RadA/Sms
VAAALISSGADRSLPADLAFFGEVGLLGEIRAVNRPMERLREARALGFARCAVPASTQLSSDTGVLTVPIADVRELGRLLQAVEREGVT